MIVRIRESNNRIKKKDGYYYIYCFVHDKELRSCSREGLVSKAVSEGWKYDYSNDVILCNECLEGKE